MKLTEIDVLIRICANHNLPLPHSITLAGDDYRAIFTQERGAFFYPTGCASHEFKYRGLRIINQDFLDATFAWGEEGWAAAGELEERLERIAEVIDPDVEGLGECAECFITNGIEDLQDQVADLEQELWAREVLHTLAAKRSRS